MQCAVYISVALTFVNPYGPMFKTQLPCSENRSDAAKIGGVGTVSSRTFRKIWILESSSGVGTHAFKIGPKGGGVILRHVAYGNDAALDKTHPHSVEHDGRDRPEHHCADDGGTWIRSDGGRRAVGRCVGVGVRHSCPINLTHPNSPK